MSISDQTDYGTCPHCGTKIHRVTAKCWLCERQVDGTFNDQNPAKAKPEKSADLGRGEMTFGLSSLMLIITLIAVCLGVFQMAPGLGILVAIIATPALIRTMLHTRRRRAAGESLTFGEKALAMLGSVGVVFSIVTAATVAFLTVCISTGFVLFSVGPSSWLNGELVAYLLIGGSSLIALAIGVLLAWKLWPMSK